jgi:hypothetical protein
MDLMKFYTGSILNHFIASMLFCLLLYATIKI